jgi:hypothetical protein
MTTIALPGFRRSRISSNVACFRCLSTKSIVRVQKDDVSTVQCGALLISPPSGLLTRGHGLTMKPTTIWPDRQALQSGDTAFRQCGEGDVKFWVKLPPSRFIAPFKMPPVRGDQIGALWRRSCIPVWRATVDEDGRYWFTIAL